MLLSTFSIEGSILMIKIILNGCNGKMGKTISSIIQNYPFLCIVAGIDKKADILNNPFPIFDDIKKCTIIGDIILDFSRPDSLAEVVQYAIINKLSIILCTTGYSTEQIEYINELSKDIPIFKSANMSIGVNVINSILKSISGFLFENYDIEIIEKHHNQKIDAPSGTALLLANTIKQSVLTHTEFTYGREGVSKRQHEEIGIHAVRGGSIVGDHEVIFAGQGEVIEIKHSALSREVFAVGALKACEFMIGKAPGLYNMDDVIRIK